MKGYVLQLMDFDGNRPGPTLEIHIFINKDLAIRTLRDCFLSDRSNFPLRWTPLEERLSPVPVSKLLSEVWQNHSWGKNMVAFVTTEEVKEQ